MAREITANDLQSYRPQLVAYAARLLRDNGEAEDVVQEALLRAPADAPPGWLYATTYRLSIDRLRDRKRFRKALKSRPAPSTPAYLERAELRDAVSALSEPYRTAVSLRYFEGLDFPDIAVRMETIERTARTWVGRGLGRLRKRFQDRL